MSKEQEQSGHRGFWSSLFHGDLFGSGFSGYRPDPPGKFIDLQAVTRAAKALEAGELADRATALYNMLRGKSPPSGHERDYQEALAGLEQTIAGTSRGESISAIQAASIFLNVAEQSAEDLAWRRAQLVRDLEAPVTDGIIALEDVIIKLSYAGLFAVVVVLSSAVTRSAIKAFAKGLVR